MKNSEIKELILQSLEHERGSVRVYETAIESAIAQDLRAEWTRYLNETRRHVQVLEGVCRKFELDPEATSPGRQAVRDLGDSLVATMRQARHAGDPVAAENVACECVVLAETKDFADWDALDLIARLCNHFPPLTHELVHQRRSERTRLAALPYAAGLMSVGRGAPASI